MNRKLKNSEVKPVLRMLQVSVDSGLIEDGGLLTYEDTEKGVEETFVVHQGIVKQIHQCSVGSIIISYGQLQIGVGFLHSIPVVFLPDGPRSITCESESEVRLPFGKFRYTFATATWSRVS